MDDKIEAIPTATTETATRDFANAIKSGAATWIMSADAKATALLAVGGAVFAIVLTGTASTSAKLEHFELGLLIVFSILLMVSIFGAATVLWPRTNRNKMLKERGHTSTIEKSPSYFGDLAKMSYSDFLATVQNPPNSVDDPIEQAYVASIIASRKMCWMKCAVLFLNLSLIALGILVIVAAYSRW